uniref:Uncharacterized protein n=1 Tax=Tanacetum cinerariifolium TaxID=118510 RepID=A0A699HKU5_TANCI|nr:hypothetical protein [Tanacetum cinerariifolium]
MHSIGKTINELHAMLKLHEHTLPRRDAHALHVIRAGKVQKKKKKNNKPQLAAKGNNKGKGKSKLAYAPKPKITPPPKKEDPTKDSEHGIIAHRTPPYMPQHIGVSKRINRTLLDMVCSMMSQTTLPKSFWDYAFEYVAHILNMVPTKKAEKIPYERDTLTKPDKLELRSIKRIFVGYPKKTMGYSFYYPPENKVFVARNAEFFKNSLIIQEASESLEDLEIIQEEDTHPSENTSSHHDKDNQEIDEPQSDIIPIRKSIRTQHALDQMCLNIKADGYKLGDLNEPANYKAALSDPEFDKCLNAKNVEMQSMKDNKVWDLVDLTPNGKIVDSKWLFKKKTDMDRVVHTYKARLIMKGFTQTLWIDYEETFSPIADIRVIRILIAIAAFYDYEI